MIETNYVPIYMKIYHIFFVIKGQFPVMDYISYTIILYFIVHCIYKKIICIMSSLLHHMYVLISYATCEWPEMCYFQ